MTELEVASRLDPCKAQLTTFIGSKPATVASVKTATFLAPMLMRSWPTSFVTPSPKRRLEADTCRAQRSALVLALGLHQRRLTSKAYSLSSAPVPIDIFLNPETSES